jgi:hypothetical protein
MKAGRVICVTFSLLLAAQAANADERTAPKEDDRSWAFGIISVFARKRPNRGHCHKSIYGFGFKSKSGNSELTSPRACT